MRTTESATGSDGIPYAAWCSQVDAASPLLHSSLVALGSGAEVLPTGANLSTMAFPPNPPPPSPATPTPSHVRWRRFGRSRCPTLFRSCWPCRLTPRMSALAQQHAQQHRKVLSIGILHRAEGPSAYGAWGTISLWPVPVQNWFGFAITWNRNWMDITKTVLGTALVSPTRCSLSRKLVWHDGVGASCGADPKHADVVVRETGALHMTTPRPRS